MEIVAVHVDDNGCCFDVDGHGDGDEMRLIR